MFTRLQKFRILANEAGEWFVEQMVRGGSYEPADFKSYETLEEAEMAIKKMKRRVVKEIND